MKTHPFFSIVIPTLNEEKYLPVLLTDLANQSFTDFEVIVVDGQSDDQTVKKAEKFLGKIQLSIFETLQRGVSAQRNFGAQKAQGSWLIFMDADNQLPPYFLLGIKYQLEKHQSTDLFTVWMDSKGYSTREERLISNTYNLGLDIYKTLKKPTAVGALLGIKKKVFKEITFDDSLAVFEDHDLVQRACKSDYQFDIFSDPQYYYSFRRFKKEGSLKMLAVFVSLNITSILGSDTQHFERVYPMKGGSYYDLNANDARFFNELSQLLKRVPQRQITKIKHKLSQLLSYAIHS